MNITNTDNAFINFSYLSEKWLAEKLSDYSAEFSNFEHIILQDEKRHTKMLLSALKKFEHHANIEHNLKYSIYEALYSRIGGFQFSSIDSFDEFKSIQGIIERRSRILYVRFSRKTDNVFYKTVLNKIIDDEITHEEHNIKAQQTPRSKEFDCIDRLVWKKLLSEYEIDGKSGQFGVRFWDNLFNEKLT